MKNLKKILSLLMAIAMVVGMLAGCGGSDDKEPAQNQDTPGDTTPIDITAPYEETVTLTSFFEISAPILNFFDPSQLEEYKMIQDMKAATNVEIDYLWYAADTAEDAETKKSTAIATGDIPDFMVVSDVQLALLAKTDLINKDLQGIWDTYASETVKEITTAEGNAPLESATFDGKLIAIPLVDSSIDASTLMWIRQDWLDNLGLERPTTMEELYNVMKAFSENDPDGDSADDTIGIAFHKNFLSAGLSDGVGIFNGFGAYPTMWLEDSNGGLTYGAIQPEVKDALAYLAKMYQEGLIQEDFSAKDDTGAIEVIAGDNAGVQFGALWNAIWPLNMSADPNANWVACPIAGVDGSGTPGFSARITGYVVINSECEHPEAVLKMLNFWAWAIHDSDEETYQSYLVDYDGSGSMQIPQHHFMLKTWSPTRNLDAHVHICQAIENGMDPSYLNAEEKAAYWDGIVAYTEGDMSESGGWKTFGPDGSGCAALKVYYDNEQYLINKFTGAPTETMAKKMTIVEDKVYEYYTKVIMGVESLDNFDAFVEEVNNLGLADITTEVNEWYASK